MYLEYSQNHKYSPIWLKRRIYPWKFSNDITHSLHYVSELFSESRILSSCLIEETHSWLARLNHKWHYTLPPLCIFIYIYIYIYICIFIYIYTILRVTKSLLFNWNDLFTIGKTQSHVTWLNLSNFYLFSESHIICCSIIDKTQSHVTWLTPLHSYRVAKIHKMPFLFRSFSAKEVWN